MFKITEERKKRLKDIGAICSQCRRYANKSREDVAKALDIKVDDIINFENGRVNNALIYDYYLSEFIY